MMRTVVAIDHPMHHGVGAPELCGIIVASRPDFESAYFIQEDASVKATAPSEWAYAAVGAAVRWKADAMIIEGHGAELVRAVLSAAGAPCPITRLHRNHATGVWVNELLGLYESGRIIHGLTMPALDEEIAAARAVFPDVGHKRDRSRLITVALAVQGLKRRPDSSVGPT